ncbi:hypothetical protein JKP88DRAFT_261097 [Tribonema minus]|uniref:Translation initiation factor IF-1, chloroplastic n=1 Tax=Tribonema minus TaxID=303371 RepID=A0A835YXL6_9STRA|nr:hypothetical protein JKP88DRAFT_261097 [Tribonema minus]
MALAKLFFLVAALCMACSRAFLHTQHSAVVPLRQMVSEAPMESRRQCTTIMHQKKKGRGGQNTEGATPREKKVKDDVIEVEGVVKESLPSAMFRVEISPTNQIILCTISGKIRKNFVRILVGDPVKVELSPYDLTRGRITFRYKK